MGENAVIIKSPVGCPAAKTNGYPGVERRLDLIHREDLTYRLDRNVFIPCNTGVIVRDAVCDDDYGEFLWNIYKRYMEVLQECVELKGIVRYN